jgi:NADH-quinone oxidoreductase subunit M
LPEAHVEAPTAGSIILAGLLLKVGTFGMLRFMVPTFDYCNSYYIVVVYVVALISIFYSGLLALRQFDLKKIVAYSSIGHMGVVVIGIFDEGVYGMAGSVFSMLSHGFVSSALFVIVGILYDRYGTRNIFSYGGLAQAMPTFSIFALFFFLANIGFPLTSNFVGEWLVLTGVAHVNKYVFSILLISLVLPLIYTM